VSRTVGLRPADREALEAIAEESLDDSPLDLYDMLSRYPSARPDSAELLSRLNPPAPASVFDLIRLSPQP